MISDKNYLYFYIHYLIHFPHTHINGIHRIFSNEYISGLKGLIHTINIVSETPLFMHLLFI